MNEIQSVLMIKDELNARFSKNPNYSLRSFAKDIELVPSHLSNFLNYKAGISKKKAYYIAQKLKWNHQKKQRFVMLIEKEFSRSKTQKEIACKNFDENLPLLNTQTNLGFEEFKFINTWQCLAVLELVKLKDFKWDDVYISKKLNLKIDDVKQLIKDLISLNLLTTRNGQLEAVDDFTFIGDSSPSLSIRRYHKNILNKALDAIDEQSIDERIYRSSIIAIKKDKINEAFAALVDFHDKFCEKNHVLENNVADNLYCISTQFFKLTD